MANQGLIGGCRACFCRFLAAEEEITIDYRFGVYDLLVLPPAFPYGGMVRTLSAMAMVLLIRVW